ncbi:MAG: haloacid dehalogenase-like hydrolase [Chloroflexi bacterium]|nr:haloacid dehalogenase-like hydrolase [Chloroflexota bacterium]
MNCFVASDLEGTLTAGEAWRGIGAYLKAHGRANAYRRFMATHFPGAILAKAGIVDKQTFKNRWLADQAKLLRGYSRVEVETLAEWVAENEMWAKRRVAVVDELTKHHASGCTVLIASGAYEPITNAFARKLNLERVRGVSTPLEMVNGRATGKLAAAIGVDAVKAQRVREQIGDGALVAAYGDTGADAPLLELSRQPVAVAPDEALRKIANAKGWRILEGE